MGIFSRLLGKDSAKAQRQASEAQINSLRDARINTEKYGAQAQGYLDPFRIAGQDAGNLYANRLGVYGPDQQAQSMASFLPSVGFNDRQGYLQNMLAQTRAAGGGLRSGKSMLAGQEIFQRGLLDDYWQQMQGLRGLYSQGVQTAGAQANTAMNTGQQVAGLQRGIGQARAAGIIGADNARNQGLSNMLSLGGSILSAGLGMPAGSIGGGMLSGMLPRNNTNYLSHAMAGTPSQYGTSNQLPWLA